MRHYEPSSPRVTFAVAAVAMTAITLGLMVVVPAEMDAYDPARMRNVPDVVTAASARVVARASSIDDESLRTPESAAVPCATVKLGRGRKS